MNKLLNPGRVHVYGILRQIFVRVSYIDGKLSIVGVIGPKKDGNCYGSCGQIDTEFTHRNFLDDSRFGDLIDSDDVVFNKGWDKEKWLNLLEAWHNWHLNDMNAGCEHQRDLGWHKKETQSHVNEECPVCKYRFGTAWRFVPVPDVVVKMLEDLPESKKECPWKNL